MSNLSQLRFFLTHPHQCSYLEEQEAVTLFVDPHIQITQDDYSRLSEVGFRRSGKHLYRPRCQHCQACVPTRIPAHLFSPNRTQRKVLKRNADLRIERLDSIADDAFYELYRRYIEERHRDGDMYPPTRLQYDSFLSSEWGITRYLAFYAGDQLLGVAVTDIMYNGLSAIYTFFDPDCAERSLGVFAILQQIELAQELGLPHVYLGYWIRKCKKMNYKTQYQPLEMLVDRSWVMVDKEATPIDLSIDTSL